MCCASYVGQTKNKLGDRINQHIRSVKSKLCTTALAKHCIGTGHSFNFNEAQILSHDKNLKERLFMEMYNIHMDKNSINFKTDIENLSSIYCNLFNKHLKNIVK